MGLWSFSTPLKYSPGNRSLGMAKDDDTPYAHTHSRYSAPAAFAFHLKMLVIF